MTIKSNLKITSSLFSRYSPLNCSYPLTKMLTKTTGGAINDAVGDAISVIETHHCLYHNYNDLYWLSNCRLVVTDLIQSLCNKVYCVELSG